jgi:branched-chain amino acid transport system substrate-binding protein
MIKKSLLGALATAGLLAAAATSAHAADTAIGTAGPMTGQYAAFGQQMKVGAEQAVKDLNAAGGLLGGKLTLEVGDDACDPKQAVAVANQMVSKGVVFMAGHFCSGSSIPASAVYSEEGVLQITPASTNPKYTDEGSWNTFRVCGRDDQQGEVAGKYLMDHFAGKKVAFLHDKSAYGKGLADATMATYQGLGGKPAMYEAYTAGEKDYTALVSKLKAENIDVVYVGGYHPEAGLIVRQMRDQGLKATLMSGDALVTDEYWAITGEAGEGTLMTFSPDPRKNPAAASVVAEFKAAGVEPEGYVLYTYAAIQVYVQAATKAGTTDAEKVAEVLKSGMTFDTVLGKLSFNGKGDVTLPGYVVYEWLSGKYDYVKS